MMKIGACLILIATLAAAPASAAQTLARWQHDALQHILDRDGVHEAQWRSPEKNALWVSIEPESYHLDSFTQFVCGLLKEAGQPAGDVAQVSVFDPPSYRSAGWPKTTFQCQ